MQMQKMGWTVMSPVGPFCNGYETPLKKDPDGNPVPYSGCDLRHPEEDCRGIGS